MKLFAPSYYKDFCCIADKCRHSCCVGWEIDIDEETMLKYRCMNGDYAEEIRKSIDDEAEGEPACFRLLENDRCPHLDSRGLCRIIMNCGEEYLCHICSHHPRFYNITPARNEVGIGLSCEEAARIILSSDGYGEFFEAGELDWYDCEWEIDPVAERCRIYNILSDRSIPYEKRLSLICKECSVSPSRNCDDFWHEVLEELEYLDETHKEQFLCYTSDVRPPAEMEESLERVLAYFVYRHTGAAKNEREFFAAVGFSLFCERLIASLVMSGFPILEAARIVSEELEYSEDNSNRLKLEFFFMLFIEADI